MSRDSIQSAQQQFKVDCSIEPYVHGKDNAASLAMTTIVPLNNTLMNNFLQNIDLMPSQKQAIQFMVNLVNNPVRLMDIMKPSCYFYISSDNPTTWPLFNMGFLSLATGMGKTPCAICFLAFMKSLGREHKSVIICTQDLLATWQHACTTWGLTTPKDVMYGQVRTTYYETNKDCDVWILPANCKLDKDAMKTRRYLIIDEVHEHYRFMSGNMSTGLLTKIRAGLFEGKFIWMLTATPYTSVAEFFKFLMTLYFGIIPQTPAMSSMFPYLLQNPSGRSVTLGNSHLWFNPRADVMKKYMMVHPKYIHVQHSGGTFGPNFKLPNISYNMLKFKLSKAERRVYDFCAQRGFHDACLVYDYDNILERLTFETNGISNPVDDVLKFQEYVDRLKYLSARNVTTKPLFQLLVSKIRTILQSGPDTRVVVICDSREFVEFFDFCNSNQDSYFQCLIVRNDNTSWRKRVENSEMLRDFNHLSSTRVMCISRHTSAVGVNLQCATHLIIPEPLWVLNDFEQTLGRIERPFGVDAQSKVEVHVIVPFQTSLADHYQKWMSDTSHTRKWTITKWGPQAISYAPYPETTIDKTFVFLPFKPSLPQGTNPGSNSKISIDDFVTPGNPIPPIHELEVYCTMKDRTQQVISFFVSDYYSYHWFTKKPEPIISIDCRNPDSVIAYDKGRRRIDIPFIKFTTSFVSCKEFATIKVAKDRNDKYKIQESLAVLCGSSSCPLKWTLNGGSIVWIRMLDFQDTYKNEWVRQNFVVDDKQHLQLRLKLQTNMQLDDSMDTDVVKHRAFRPYALLRYKTATTYDLHTDVPTFRYATGVFIESGFDVLALGVYTEFFKFENGTRCNWHYDALSTKCVINHNISSLTARIAISYQNLQKRQTMSMFSNGGSYHMEEPLPLSRVHLIPAVLQHKCVRMIMCREKFGAYSFMRNRKQAEEVELPVRKVRKLLPSDDGQKIYIKFSDRDNRQDSAARDLISLSSGAGSSSLIEEEDDGTRDRLIQDDSDDDVL